eukprot:CAMPEP_0113304444 /NCGR_PEP_ID=MMETSP0010_2-20120614/4463_1 /TAXON_ID=216773 ORGANISM="Corethron hystrix, Strain 308" /NCGR_SAMPLE_ID=MMETSP0010_2 /ASSEMBLY_ACC=CAM_ASM_000155 /LENGTH=271 /DNA_ID=CAMNT_0000158653 /DNA_START=82 /DNA_END=895 /DNA_ORIENTATION=- /assembly_acc=CAM_ASM_000155
MFGQRFRALVTSMATCHFNFFKISIFHIIGVVPLSEGKNYMQNNDLNFFGSKTPRIFKGSSAAKGRFNYFVKNEKSQYLCGGVLVADNIVLTAAHCEGLFNHVGVGKHSLFDIPHRDYEPVESSLEIPHPDYAGKPTLDNDFMIVVLKERVMTPPACIARSSTILNAGDNMTVIGFGEIEGNTGSIDLQQANVHYITNKLCFENYMKSYLISRNMMCTSSNEGKDACKGDSGGDQTGNNAAEDLVVGLVSWGVGCGEHPGVYARISAQFDW